MRRFRAVLATMLSGATTMIAVGTTVSAQTTVKQPQPGFNLFSVEQDIEIGRQSAVEAEKQLTLLNDVTVDRYLNRIIQRLAAQAPGAAYQYRIKTVNASEINAFALPGGPMYVNRGLLTAARNEAELAGVLAHEMSHVALRHGTHQASKAYLANSGLGILGGLFGKSSSSSILRAIGGVGLNAAFLKFSRDDEYEADESGAQIMARAGYDPAAMANFFELLRAEAGRDPSKLEQFFSDHPPAAAREARIRQLATTLGGGKTQVVGGFDVAVARARRLPATTTPQVVTTTSPQAPGTVVNGQVVVQVDRPSTRLVHFSQPNGFFTIDYPSNWQAYPSGMAVSMAPEGGAVTRSDGQQVMIYGVIINHYQPFNNALARRNQSLQRNYAPFEDRTADRGALEDATDDLVNTLLQSNPYLQVQNTAAQPEVIDGAAGFSLILSGLSPVTRQQERVTVYTRGLPDGHVIYALSVVPEGDAGLMAQTFDQMIRTLLVNDSAIHRSTTARANRLRVP